MTIGDRLLSAHRPQFEDVTIDAGDVKIVVRVHALTGRDFFEFQKSIPTVADEKKARGEKPAPGDENLVETLDVPMRMLCVTCRDPETGERVFPADRFEDVKNAPWQMLKLLVDAQDRINKGHPDAKKLSAGTPATGGG